MHKSNIWRSMFLANQIAGFFNQPYPEKIHEMLDFLQVDANSHKLKIDQKFSWWVWSKMAVSKWVLGWTDFLHACANSGKLKVILMIFGGYSQKWVWPFSLWDPKICCILKWVYELSWTLHADCDAIIFWLNWYRFLYILLLSDSLLQLYFLDPRQ